MPPNVNDAIAPPVAGAITTRAAPAASATASAMGWGAAMGGRQPAFLRTCASQSVARETIMPMSELTATHE